MNICISNEKTGDVRQENKTTRIGQNKGCSEQ